MRTLPAPAAAILLAGLAAAAPLPAGAVVPGADAVLARAAEAQPRPAPLVATLLEAPEGDAPPRHALRVVSDGEGRVRLDAEELDTGTIVSRVFAEGAAAAGGGALPLDAAPAWVQWLVGRPADRVARALGVDRERTALAHRDGTVLWVVGAGPREAARPQLQVERATGRLRVVVEAEAGPPPPAGEAPPSGEARPDEAPPRVRRATLDGRQAEEGPGAAWPATVTLEEGGASTVFRVAALRVGGPVDPAELAPPAPPPVAP